MRPPSWSGLEMQVEAESWVCSESRRQRGILSPSATPSWDGVETIERQALLGDAQ